MSLRKRSNAHLLLPDTIHCTQFIALGKVSVLRTTHHKAHHIDTPDDGFLSSCLQKYYIVPTLVVVHNSSWECTMDPDKPERTQSNRFTVTLRQWQQTRKHAWTELWEEIFLSASAVSIKAKQKGAAVQPGVYDTSHPLYVRLTNRRLNSHVTWRWLSDFADSPDIWYRPVTY